MASMARSDYNPVMTHARTLPLQRRPHPATSERELAPARAGAFDRSPRLLAQRREVEAIQQSALLVAQRQALSAVFGPSRAPVAGPFTAQLKPLSKKTLNVVGEEHDETNLPGRPAIEKQIARNEAAGDYWTESEFKARDKVWWETAGNRIGAIDDNRAAADPMVLRAHYSSVVACSGADRLLRWIEAKGDGPIDEDGPGKAEVMKALTGNCNHVLAGLMALQKSGATRPESEDWGDSTGGEATALKLLTALANRSFDPVLALCRRAAKCTGLGELRDQIAADRELIQGVKDVMEQEGPKLLQTARAKWKAPLEREEGQRGPLTGTAPARFLRSMAMGRGAETRSETLGVWKVGDSHVVDIANQAPPGAYTMLTRKEFNDEYAERYKLPLKRD
jgi:hypothetical protein